MTAKKHNRSLFTKAAFAFGLSATALTPAHAGEWDLSGSVGAETRAFFQESLTPGQLDTFQPSLLLEGDIRWRSDDDQFELVLVPYARLDAQDDRRTHTDMREAYVRWNGDSWSVRAGLAKVFWGVTESRHLVDIINQFDTVEDIDEEDKLGQPMLEITTTQDWGQLTGYIMPAFRKRTFPGRDGRLRFPILIDNDLAQFDQGRDDDEDIDLALRYSHYFGDWDVGVSVFHGASREPRLQLDTDSLKLAPFYDDITQIGVDLQYTTGAWLWKMEGIVRDTPFETFTAAVAGFEYSFYGITDSGADLGLLMEIQYDGRSENPDFAALTPADNDIFIGTRLAMNDAQDTAFLGGIVTDWNDGSMSGLVEASRRFGDAWIAEIEGRFFMNTARDNLLHTFRRDSHIMLRLTHHF